MRTCSKCGLAKLADDFHRDRTKPDGRRPSCKPCDLARHKLYRDDPENRPRLLERSREWRLANPDLSRRGIRNATLKKKYGITAEEFDLMFEAQGRSCVVCLRTESRGSGAFHVDHDHATGRIRGILCQPCNTTLGKCDDRPDLLRRLADYLEVHHQDLAARH